ncbi:MAG: putative Ig domain-containing protein [Raineya sp.]|jgi:uncharacterized delta-60 repeat protein|nr:putative Ig domain-containing protein [Raineya sp.]
MKRKNYLIVLMSLICMCFGNQYTWAQAGSNDATFNVADNGRIFGTVYSVVHLANGKILVGGIFKDGIARLNADGTIDNTFNIGTGFNGNGHIFRLILQSDGKILAGGNFIGYNGTSRNNIARLNADGTLDNTFNVGTGFNGAVYSVVLQSDGKILVGGSFSNYNGTITSRIARLNADGTLDSSFNTGSGFDATTNALAIQSDGKILVGGSFTNYNGTTRNNIARLNVNGTLDTGFSVGTGFNSPVVSFAIQSDGKILVGGNFSSYNGSTANRIVRLNTGGSLDNTFNNGGSGFTGSVQEVVIQPSTNYVWVAGGTTYNGTATGGLVRLNGSTGAIDNPASMGSGGGAFTQTLAFQSDGKILVGGGFQGYNGVNFKFGLVRLNTDGSLDNTLKNNTGIWGDGGTFVKVQSDDKIILYGDIRVYNGTPINRITRLNADGTLDNTLNVGTGFNQSLSALTIQSDGKILVGGSFTSYNGTPVNKIARLNPDGTLDNTFSTTGTGFNSRPNVFALQSDGKILVGGSFTSYNGTARNRIARLNADGTLDNTFSIGTGFDNSVDVMSLQPDGKILVAGGFNDYNGTTCSDVVRLNSNGSLDNTFSPTGTGFDSAPRIFLFQSDGKILVGGIYEYNGVVYNELARLNANGTIDNTFNIGTGFDNSVNDISFQPNGKILVMGGFTSYNGTPSNGLIQLNPNGTIDATFNAGIGFNDDAYSLGVQKNGKIIISGNFSRYNGVARNGLVRIMPSCPNSSTLSDLPTAPLLQPYSQTLSQNGLNGSITWSVTAGTLPAGLTLNSSTGVISGTPTTPVTAVFTVQASNGACTATKEYNFVVDPIAGIEPKTQIIEKVYPNPSQDKIQIDLKQSGSYSFRMLNSLGKLVQEGKTEGSKAVLDISSLPQGLYFLEISGQKQSIKIIKQ